MIRRQYFSIGTLAAASLLLESTLTRLLAVSQFYHFAFLVVSLALLGYGASGSILFLLNQRIQLTPKNLNFFLFWLGIGFSISVCLAYGIINYLPFDSYSIAWDQRQLLYFGLFYLSLTLPFLLSGAATGAALSASGERKHLIYAANLLGSGLGVLLALGILQLSGVPGGVMLSALMGMVAILPLHTSEELIRKGLRFGVFVIILTGLFSLGYLTWRNLGGDGVLGLVISPYKGLSQAMRIPRAERLFGGWNAVSRIDLIKEAGTHRLPGLSYLYEGYIPEQYGLATDANSLQPVTLILPSDFHAASYLPEAVVFDLFDRTNVLVVEPGGGLGVLQSLSGGAEAVTVIMGNPLEKDAIHQGVEDGDIYQDPRVSMVYERTRPYFNATQDTFDVVYFPLVDSYRPVASGAFSLSENYDLTVEAFQDAIGVLSPGGILVVTRWLQTPPSESVRVFVTLLEAMADTGVQDLQKMFIAYRSIQTMTILLKPSGWSETELEGIREFVSRCKYDLVWLPGVEPAEVNRNNKLPEPHYYLLIKDLLFSENREAIYRSYPFDISPPSDDYPFFYHFFKWGQTREIIATMGHTWQPFGGSGFLVLFALLTMVLITSIVLILLPLFFKRVTRMRVAEVISPGKYFVVFAYFTFLGFAFLFIEIPLIQKAILLLGHPIYAFTTVVFTVLFFSGLGSAVSRSSHISSRLVMLLTPMMALLIPVLFNHYVEISLGWSMFARMLVIVLSLAPLAFLMGFPFPYGLISLRNFGERIIPWIWAVNGSISVAASVVAAILNLSVGFQFVLVLGAGMYAGASVIYLIAFQRLKPGINGIPNQ